MPKIWVISKFLSCILLLSACSSAPLSIQTTYLTPEYLASYVVETPDVRLECPFLGHQLNLTWNLNECYPLSSTKIELTIRFRNRTEENIIISLNKKSGDYVYRIMNDEFIETGGILTYKADIKVCDEVVHTLYHQLWVDLISFDEQCPE